MKNLIWLGILSIMFASCDGRPKKDMFINGETTTLENIHYHARMQLHYPIVCGDLITDAFHAGNIDLFGKNINQYLNDMGSKVTVDSTFKYKQGDIVLLNQNTYGIVSYCDRVIYPKNCKMKYKDVDDLNIINVYRLNDEIINKMHKDSYCKHDWTDDPYLEYEYDREYYFNK